MGLSIMSKLAVKAQKDIERIDTRPRLYDVSEGTTSKEHTPQFTRHLVVVWLDVSRQLVSGHHLDICEGDRSRLLTSLSKMTWTISTWVTLVFTRRHEGVKPYHSPDDNFPQFCCTFYM